MRRDVVIGSLTALGLSFYIFQNYLKSKDTYRRFDISPIVYKPNISPIDTKKSVTGNVFGGGGSPVKTYKAAYSVEYEPSKFQDKYSLETFMELPLDTDGKSHETQTSFKDLEEEPSLEEPVFVKYLRFHCTEIRDPSSPIVRIGGFKFLQGNAAASTKPVQIWNPHSGKTATYGGEEWSDNDQHLVVFCFADPVIVTRYELVSSKEPPSSDPIHWKIEGSMNGTFWSIMDDRLISETAFPVERGKAMKYNMNI